MKTALITGGSRGIGSAICKALSANHKVVIGYSNSKEEAKKLEESINSNGGNAMSIKIDVSDKNSINTSFEEIEESYGIVEVLVNNAGITRDNILPRMKDSEWDDVIQTNLTGSYLTT